VDRVSRPAWVLDQAGNSAETLAHIAFLQHVDFEGLSEVIVSPAERGSKRKSRELAEDGSRI
jgi:hypothetical protein